MLGVAGVIWWQDFRDLIRCPLNWGLGVLSLWLIIISCFAAQQAESFIGLGNFIPYFLFFATFCTLIQKPSQLRQLAWVLVIGSTPPIVLGFGQILGGWHTPMLVFGWELIANGNPSGRMASVFMYANTFSAYLLLVLVLALGLVLSNSKTDYNNLFNN